MSETPTTAELAARYCDALRAEREMLSLSSGQTAADRRPVGLDQQSVGRLSRMDALQGQAMAQAMEARRAARSRTIAAALRRIEDGDFGYCADCGEFIGWARLDIDACVPRCRDCAA